MNYPQKHVDILSRSGLGGIGLLQALDRF